VIAAVNRIRHVESAFRAEFVFFVDILVIGEETFFLFLSSFLRLKLVVLRVDAPPVDYYRINL
jgi:hypothetical protein